ncbi:MAG: symporter small accessory protein [Bacillota bacterium]
MFGMQDVSIALAWFLSLGSAVICVVYGAIKWNKGGDE